MKKIKIFLLAIVIVLSVIACAAVCFPKKNVSEYEEKVNAITETDYEKQQDELNAIVEEGKMNVNYVPYAEFDGKTSISFHIKNIKNNHFPIVFEILDETERVIYKSKMIEPGYEMNAIELEKELTSGTHDCKIKIGYAEEGNVSSVFPITIEVR